MSRGCLSRRDGLCRAGTWKEGSPARGGDRGDIPDNVGRARVFVKGSGEKKKCRSVVINAKGIECFWRGEEGGQRGFASLDVFAWERLFFFFFLWKGERTELGQVRRERCPRAAPAGGGIAVSPGAPGSGSVPVAAASPTCGSGCDLR